jgi:hypothetical protein
LSILAISTASAGNISMRCRVHSAIWAALVPASRWNSRRSQITKRLATLWTCQAGDRITRGIASCLRFSFLRTRPRASQFSGFQSGHSDWSMSRNSSKTPQGTHQNFSVFSDAYCTG